MDLGTWAILHAWVLDMDISEFFDTKDYELLLKAIRIHVTEKCVSIIERWLRVSYEDQDGNLTAHKMGVPQGLVIYLFWLICSCITCLIDIQTI